MAKKNANSVARILIVDDNADMRLTTKLLLEMEGYEVELAANGREAIEVQRARPAQVLLTDLFMPDADGFETIERFRKEFPGIRIIAMSGGGSCSKRCGPCDGPGRSQVFQVSLSVTVRLNAPVFGSAMK
jgi:CheY-like chemotaxis protein